MPSKRFQSLTVFLFMVITSSLTGTLFAESPTTINKETVTIWSQGVRLEGDLYKPDNLAPDKKLPGLLLIPGWGGSKKNIEKNYAPYYASQGFIVLAFDFKGWGESDGPIVATQALPKSEEAAEIEVKTTHYRKMINPLSMSEDVRAALSFLGSEPRVMPNNLGIWGTSMGGGLALVTAATDDRVKALVNQMGPVNYRYNLRGIPDQRVREAEAMVARGLLPPYPGPQGQSNPLLRGYPDWIAMKRFNPMAYVDRLTMPTLIIEAEQEELYEREKNGVLMYEMIKDRIESRYIAYPGTHYDMYSGKNLEAGREAGLQWFVKHLKSI